MDSHRPIIIAGPCAAESPEIMDIVAKAMSSLAKELDFHYVFKASFDKANRTSQKSYRGPGMETGLKWLGDIKSRYGAALLTDIHESAQAGPVGEVCDVLQIPAFLCRQTDLVVAAAETGRIVNVKKGQFVAPGAMANVVDKVLEVEGRDRQSVWLTERGSSFGYGDLVVDMRSLPTMAETGAPVIFDITHSTQRPAAGTGAGGVSGAQRRFAGVLARAAVSTGYVSGLFLEVHPEPAAAKSDAEAQLTPQQAEQLLRQLVPMMKERHRLREVDSTLQV